MDFYSQNKGINLYFYSDKISYNLKINYYKHIWLPNTIDYINTNCKHKASIFSNSITIILEINSLALSKRANKKRQSTARLVLLRFII